MAAAAGSTAGLEGLRDLRSANPLLSPSSALGRAAQHPTTIPEPIEISNVIEINVPSDDNQEIGKKCLAAGGARVDLDGNVAGEVSREQRCRAERLVARIKARQLAEAAAAKAEPESEKTLTRAALRPSILNGKVLIMPPPAETTPPTGSGRLGLAELKRAALERREAKCR